MDALETQAAGRGDVGLYVVNKNGVLGVDSDGFERITEYQGRRLAGADDTRISANGFWEESKEVESGFEMGDVDGIRVRKKPEAIVLSKSLEERIVLKRLRIKGAIPRFREFLEAERSTEALR